MKERSDNELISMLAGFARDRACSELYRRYAHRVYGVCLRYLNHRDDSLDAVTDIFEMLLKKPPRMLVDNAAAWLHTVAKNHCLQVLRNRTRHQIPETQLNEGIVSEVAEPECNQVAEAEMQQAIGQLSDAQQTCILMFYYNRKSYLEISEETGIPVAMVKSHLQNGRIKLKKILKK